MKNYNLIGKRFGRLFVTGLDEERIKQTGRSYVKVT